MTGKTYKLSWTEGNMDTISIASTVSDDKVYLQCSHTYTRMAMSCNYFHTFTYITKLEWGGGLLNTLYINIKLHMVTLCNVRLTVIHINI